MEKTTIAISGASGFIGRRLAQYLKDCGYNIIPLGITIFRRCNQQELLDVIGHADIVINLAGAPIDKKWTDEYKREIWNSRILTTQKLVKAINSTVRTKLFISASAVGFYSSNDCHTEEDNDPGSSFLSLVCERWEHEAKKVRDNVRLAITRLGIVFDHKGGAFPKMTMSYPFRIATIIGNGNDYISWVDREDLVSIMRYIIDHDELDGVINVTAPEPCTQSKFAEVLCKKMGKCIKIHIPKLLLSIFVGESSELMTKGQCAIPHKLTISGYEFISPTLSSYLNKT